MLIKGVIQPWDKNGDGIVDIEDLTRASEELNRIVKEIVGITKYISGDGELPNLVDVDVDVKIQPK